MKKQFESITVPRVLDKEGHFINVIFQIRREHYVLLSAVAEQWHMSFGELIENLASKIFKRDIVKIRTIVNYLALHNFTISDIAGYLKLGEYDEKRIEYLRRQGMYPDGTRKETEHSVENTRQNKA